MSKHRIPDRNIVDTIYREVKDLAIKVRLLQQVKNPTMPEYNPNDLPPDFPEGGFFIGTDNAFYVKRNNSIVRIGP